MDNSNYKQAQILFKAWNELDSSLLKDWLSKDVIYESHWIVLPLIGKDSVIDFLSKKFETIKKHNLVPEVSLIQSDDNEYMVLVKLELEDESSESIFRVSIRNRLISGISIIPIEMINIFHIVE